MRTDETLLLQALKIKELTHKGSSGPDLVERLLDANPEEAKKSMRNICAFISPQLFDDVNGLSNVLELSKRQIVEMALLDFIEKAHKIIKEVDPFPVDPFSPELEG
jgi:hypothetical protein